MMPQQQLISPNDIRAAFAASLSAMYCAEVPAYQRLLSLVSDVNTEVAPAKLFLNDFLAEVYALDRFAEERHGAIRLGTGIELSIMRRVFAVMGMFPVGYYDLSEAGICVHATAFRPTAVADLKINPLRIFTSLLRLDLMKNDRLRNRALEILAARRIVTDAAMALVEKAEIDGGLNLEDAECFISELLKTFGWRAEAAVDIDLYSELLAADRLIADVVAFKGSHLNHLTPGTLDIDSVQARMPSVGISPKSVIEGPPARACPILLRQTSFKAVAENVFFPDAKGRRVAGLHTARFGEIEQRGIALTPAGRRLYDRLLSEAHQNARLSTPKPDTGDYSRTLAAAFRAFPDDWSEIRRRGLGYFTYRLSGCSMVDRMSVGDDFDTLVEAGVLLFDPIIYEDFLPVSAAGIFQSNLGEGFPEDIAARPNQALFEQALGTKVADEFELYADMQQESINRCLGELRLTAKLRRANHD